jgi:hypothetical protein
VLSAHFSPFGQKASLAPASTKSWLSSPANLEGAEATFPVLVDDVRHPRRFVHQERAVGLDAIAVAPAEEAAHGKPGGLAEDVPERDIDTRDRVGQRAAATHPEGVLVEDLAYPLRLERVLPENERLQHF